MTLTPLKSMIKFSASTINKKPDADIKTRIKASVVLFSIIVQGLTMGRLLEKTTGNLSVKD